MKLQKNNSYLNPEYGSNLWVDTEKAKFTGGTWEV